MSDKFLVTTSPTPEGNPALRGQAARTHQAEQPHAGDPGKGGGQFHSRIRPDYLRPIDTRVIVHGSRSISVVASRLK